jgi:hypothetical protein
MVDVVRVKPAERGAGGCFRTGGLVAFEPFNLKRKGPCRPAAGAAHCHIWNNHKLQNPQASVDCRVVSAAWVP